LAALIRVAPISKESTSELPTFVGERDLLVPFLTNKNKNALSYQFHPFPLKKEEKENAFRRSKRSTHTPSKQAYQFITVANPID